MPGTLATSPLLWGGKAWGHEYSLWLPPTELEKEAPKARQLLPTLKLYTISLERGRQKEEGQSPSPTHI